jgi:glycosyltransferase involved in cell wall biosynthesis
MMLGYTGQFDVFFARLLSWLDRRPLVLDVLMSIHLIASERRLPYRKLLRWVEGIALRIPDMLIIDTPENGEWFENFYGISRSRFRLVPIGADNRYFRPVTGSPSNNVFRVVYHGSFLPLHGVEHIVQAAALLREHQDIHFDLVGDGPMRKAAQSLARRLQVSQVDFPGWIDHRLLLSQMASADVLLGVFGTTEMAKRTIQNKIYEGLAMARPVISADGPAVRRVFTHREHAYLVESANPEALANAILTLRSKPCLRAHLAETGYHLFMEKFSVEAVGKVARGHLERLLDPSSSAPETAQARLTI